jgi:hypothetical protein
MCRRLADHRCTPHKIVPISGRKSLREVARYTQTANRNRLADDAISPIMMTEKRTRNGKHNRLV